MSYDAILAAGVLAVSCVPLLSALLGRRAAALMAASGIFCVILPVANLLARGSRDPVERAARDAARPVEVRRDRYVSSRACRACHPRQHATWWHSYHRRMTQVATPESVMGTFDGRQLYSYGRWYRLQRRGDSFWVTMQRGGPRGPSPNERATAKPVVMTTGSHHYQVYWLASGKSRVVENLPFVYQLAEQRWIPRGAAFLGPEEKTRHSSGNWNLTCIKCHATHGVPEASDFDAMQTRVAEFGIACEACHGPGGPHTRANRSPWRRYRLHHSGQPDPTIVNPRRLDHRAATQVCGQCHGIHLFYKDHDWWHWVDQGWRYRPGQELSDTRLTVQVGRTTQLPAVQSMLRKAPDYLRFLFWSDGMVRVSGREYNGLLETPCFVRGELSCLSCHQLHQPPGDPRPEHEWANDQLRYAMDGNRACLQCHQQYAPADVLAAHTHHLADSSGSLCYNCHMPYTTYGLLKAIRSHQIDSPRVEASLRTGRPNACNQCHLDKTLGWAADHLTQWYSQPKPSLPPEMREISAAVLWLIRGDAGQRALMAWSFGWPSARAVSGTDWMPPLLAQLLNDPYQAVRLIAHRSLTRLDGWHDLPFRSVLAPPAMRARVVRRVVDTWRQLPADRRQGHDAVLVGKDGTLRQAELDRLLGQRDDTTVELHE